jgi:hypothetical protein
MKFYKKYLADFNLINIVIIGMLLIMNGFCFTMAAIHSYNYFI